MDDHQREINRAKQLYAQFSYGRLRVIADTDGMPVANKAAALELMHEAELTIARRAERRSTIALWLSGAAIIVALSKLLLDLVSISPKSDAPQLSPSGVSPQQMATPAATP